MPLILPGNVGSATAATGYNVANSVRFNPGDSAYMHKTPSAGNRQKATFSCWVKRSLIGSAQTLFWAGSDNSNYQTFPRFLASDKLVVGEVNSGSTTWEIVTDRVFRDVSAWYHIVIAMDTTQGTAANRIKIYVNGVQETSLDTSGGYPAEDRNTLINTGVPHQIGHDYVAQYYGGYVAEACFLEAAQSAPTDFGEFDSDSGIWKPINVSGLTFGTNGFYLDFEDSANLGNDANGGTDLTEVNLAATDQTTDTCTNNFCTCNPLDQTNTGGSSATMAEGNLKWTSAGNATSQSYMRATFGLTAGKWYWEAKMSAANSGPGFQIGVAGTDADMNAGSSGSMNDSDPNTQFVNAASSASSTRKDGSNVTTSLTTVAEDQIVQIALDLDNQKFYIGVQGTYLNSADPAAGSNAPATVDANTTYLPAWCDNGYADQITLELNFGNPTFSISSGNTDGNGYGNFEYAPPSGFLALCTKNLGSDGG